jgi:hypothetical protein
MGNVSITQGIGASWYAIETSGLGRSAHGGVLGGSAWGASPPAEDKAAWQTLYHYANWLGLDWWRAELVCARFLHPPMSD